MVFEDGGQRRDFVHVRDIAKATVLAAERHRDGMRAFNVGSGTPRTVGEMASALARALDGPEPIVTGKFRLADVRHITADSSRLRDELGCARSALNSTNGHGRTCTNGSVLKEAACSTVDADRHRTARPDPGIRSRLHPLPLRLMHWINAVTIFVMIGSGWKIYDDEVIFGWLHFPDWLTIGRWAQHGLQWHFFGMWILVINGLAYLGYGFATGRFRRMLLPIRLARPARDVSRRAALPARARRRDRLQHGAEAAVHRRDRRRHRASSSRASRCGSRSSCRRSSRWSAASRTSGSSTSCAWRPSSDSSSCTSRSRCWCRRRSSRWSAAGRSSTTMRRSTRSRSRPPEGNVMTILRPPSRSLFRPTDGVDQRVLHDEHRTRRKHRASQRAARRDQPRRADDAVRAAM